MFGMNEIVGRKYFEPAGDGALLVTSLFMTLQGEGPFAGQPAFFVRLAKCNLACTFCDTYFDSGSWFTREQLLLEISERIWQFFGGRGQVPAWAQKQPWKQRAMVLVITGGEPFLQSENLVPFLHQAHEVFENVQIESNGILVPEGLPDLTYLVCSPKCAEKGGKATQYLKPQASMLDRADCLKFVISADSESPYHTVPDWALKWRDQTEKPVYVSPMNIYNTEPKRAKEMRAAKQGGEITLDERSTVDEVISFWEPGLLNMEANRANHEYAAHYAIRNGLYLSLQTHLLASVA